MTELSKNTDNVQEECNRQTERINDMIKEFLDLAGRLKTREKNRDQWKGISTALSTSIWARQIKYAELRKRESDLRVAITDTMKLTEHKEQELKLLEKERAAMHFEQRDTFQVDSRMYANKFLGAYREYTTESLSKNTQQINDECKEIYNDLSVLTKELENLQAQCGLNDLGSNAENNEVVKINNVLANTTENYNCKLLEIVAAQDTLKKMRNEIRQKIMMLEVIKN